MMFQLSQLTKLYPILDTSALEAKKLLSGMAAKAHAGWWGETPPDPAQSILVREYVLAGESVADQCRQHGVTLVINDRADFAMLLGSGLHVGQDDLPPSDARR